MMMMMIDDDDADDRDAPYRHSSPTQRLGGVRRDAPRGSRGGLEGVRYALMHQIQSPALRRDDALA
eukprot:9083054-Pyramimonas_sp.AAC.1